MHELDNQLVTLTLQVFQKKYIEIYQWTCNDGIDQKSVFSSFKQVQHEGMSSRLKKT